MKQMTQAELYTLLSSTGISTCYYSWKASGTTDIPSLPWLVYLVVDTDNESADNKVYKKGYSYSVELYSNKKDLDNEKIVEELFDENEIFYNKTETYIETEQMFQIAYSIFLYD